MASPGDDTIETAALGRPFQLGMLYDCRKDALIPGITLWDQDQLQKNTSVKQKINTEFNVTTSDTIEEKSNSLKITGSLKLSLLGGLVDVGGSAKYFQDTKKSHNQARMTLQYKTTTKFETLTMAHLGRGQVSHPNVFEDDTATHVVTAILYGAGAYFVFDRESLSNDEKKEVEAEANLTFIKLKFLTVESGSEASFNIDEKEKSAVEKFSCTFHGDFQLPSNPTSFSDAVSVYRDLPKMLGENGEHAVPLRVWLYPLCKLHSTAARLQRDISNDLITYSADIIESLTTAEMRCIDILKDTATATFPAMKKKVQTFIQKCHQYKLNFKQKLGLMLPSIRGGGKEESALSDIHKEHENSPFNSKDLDQWLTNKEKESHTLKSFLKQLEKLSAKMEDVLEDLLFEVKNVVCFSFTSIDHTDHFLVKLSNYLKPMGVVESPTESSDLQAGNTAWLSAETRKRMMTQFKLFEELKKMNTSDDTKFIVDSKYDESHPGACIFIYEDGSGDPVHFIPPSQPASPATSVSHDSITVQVSGSDSATVEHLVEYREKQNHETEWKSYPVQKNQEPVTLSGLKPETEYEVRVRAVGKLSYAISSNICRAVTLIAVGPPTELRVTEVKANSIILTWNSPSVQHCESVKQYIIEFRENNNQWQRKNTREEVYTFTLKNLKENTTYSIRMCTEAVVVSEPGEEIQIKTKKGPLDTSKFTPLRGDPPVYLLKPTAVGYLNQKVFGGASRTNASNKTIMVVGATGSGKTTLINGMINYIFGVDWEDNWRFKLINEETNTTQACSQTTEVTAYKIHHTDEFRVPYSLTIIDTPGYGDTRGIKYDKEITEKIRKFFSVKDGIDSIDAVCFVVQSALARLTHAQRYIFEAILSIFGKDIANNIIALVTFADGKLPPVLEAIKAADIPCATNPDGSFLHFKFNNSVLFAKKSSTAVSNDDNFDHMFWKMGETSMNHFFTHLASMQPQSLTLTIEVLEERRQLEATVQGLQPMIQKGLSTLEVINTTKAAMQYHEAHMKDSENFEYVVMVEKCQKIDLQPGTFITNCYRCNYSCHYPCGIANDLRKMMCSVMKMGRCTVCPGKCLCTDHYNMTYRWVTKRVQEKRTYQELKHKYEAAMGEKMNTEQIIRQLEVEHAQVQQKTVEMMETVAKSLQRLKEIALCPDPLDTPDYIDLLIQTEEHEAKPGFTQRIKELQEVKQGAVIVQKMAKNLGLNQTEISKWEKMTSKAKGVYNDFKTLWK